MVIKVCGLALLTKNKFVFLMRALLRICVFSSHILWYYTHIQGMVINT